MRRTTGLATLFLTLSLAAPARADLIYVMQGPPGGVILSPFQGPYVIDLTLPDGDSTGFALQPFPAGSSFKVRGGQQWDNLTGAVGSSDGAQIDSGSLSATEPGNPAVSVFIQFHLFFDPNAFVEFSQGRNALFFTVGDFFLTAVPEPGPLALAGVGVAAATGLGLLKRRARAASGRPSPSRPSRYPCHAAVRPAPAPPGTGGAGTAVAPRGAWRTDSPEFSQLVV
jgi:hypothetical protein